MRQTTLKALSGFNAGPADILISSQGGPSNVTVSDMALDASLSSSTINYGIFFGSATTAVVQRVKITQHAAAAGAGVWMQAVTLASILDSEITAGRRGTVVLGGGTRITIARNKVHDILDYGIEVIGDASTQSDDVTVDDNDLWNIIGGTPRQPIYFTSAVGFWHRRPRITDNRVTGNGTGFATTGNGDLIAAYFMEDAIVSGNVTRLGGDIGIAVWNARKVTVTGNVSFANDTDGITTLASTDVTITGNVTHSNLQDKGGIYAATNLGGIHTDNSSNIIIAGNRSYDPQASKTQKWGVYVETNCSNVLIGANQLSGNKTGNFGGSVSIDTVTALTYGATIATDASLGNLFSITATNGTAFTISNPTNLAVGQRLVYTIRNTSGGALGVITWGATFKLAAFTAPATATSRSIEFMYNGTNLVQLYQSAADVPN